LKSKKKKTAPSCFFFADISDDFASLTLSKSGGGPNRRLVDYFFVCGLSTTLEAYDATSTTSSGNAPLASKKRDIVSNATPCAHIQRHEREKKKKKKKKKKRKLRKCRKSHFACFVFFFFFFFRRNAAPIPSVRLAECAAATARVDGMLLFL
jgi:hypothetical protein